MQRLTEWLEEKRLEAKRNADHFEEKVKAGHLTADILIQMTAWQAREVAFKEMERRMGYEV